MKIYVKLPDETVREAAGNSGQTIMEVMRDAGVPVRADCGGAMACASCHVVVDDEWMPLVGAADGEESDLLDASNYRAPNSRLSCQIKAVDKLDRLSVTLQLDALEA